MLRRALALALLALVLSGCSAVDGEQARLCRLVPFAIEPAEIRVRILSTASVERAPNAVRVSYAAVDGQAAGRIRFVTCAFAGGTLSSERTSLIGVETDTGRMSGAAVLYLERFFLGRQDTPAEVERRTVPARGSSLPVGAAFLLQAVLNGLPGAALLGLVATGYALLYGITHRINLAMGDIAVTGAFGGLAAVALTGALGGSIAVAATAAIGAATLTAGLLARALGETVVAPLVAAPGRMLLVATIGVEIVIQEFLRLTQGARDRWLPPGLGDTLTFVVGEGFAVGLTTIQIGAVGLAVLVAGLTVLAMRRTRFGLFWRAVADDPLAARLMGVDPRAVLLRAMLLAGLLAGLAGSLIVVVYGNAHFAMGASLGLMAIVAAILGGIGSVPGAMAGGVLIGMAEAIWSAYFPIEWQEVAVYGALAVFLALRPDGVMGRAGGERRRG